MPAVERPKLGPATATAAREVASVQSIALHARRKTRHASSLRRNLRFAATCANRAVDVLDQSFESLLVVEPVVRGLPAHSVAEQVPALREHCRAAVFSDTQGFHRRHLVAAGLYAG